jgi:hypothetical protein
MAVLQQRFAPEREPRERAFRGGKVVGMAGHERNLTRTPVRFKASRPEVTKLAHMVVAGVSDQGQMSRLLARLEGLGLLENRGTRELGAPYAWHLTARGEETLSASRPLNTATEETR